MQNSFFTQLSPDFTAAGLLEPEHMTMLKEAGFNSVIINIPDGEMGALQSDSDAMLEACRQAGLEAVYQPVPIGQITIDQIMEFSRHLQNLPGPTLAYCKSGGRCCMLYRAAQHLTQGE